MARSRKDDVPDIRLPAGQRHARLALVFLAVAIVLAFLLACVIGIVLAVVLVSRDDTPSKLPGAWKGRFVLRGQATDVVYTFNKDGTFLEEDFDLIGRKVNNAGGRWTFRDGKVVIDWDRGSFEHATVHWVNNSTIDYRIVDHIDALQIGTATTFRRLGN